MNTTEQQRDKEFEVYFTLQDDNLFKPMSATYILKVMVWSKDIDNTVDFETNQAMVKVQIERPDDLGKFLLHFSKPTLLPLSSDEWTGANEGSERLKIKLIKSEHTEAIELDQDVSLSMTWRVRELITTFAESGRMLQASS